MGSIEIPDNAFAVVFVLFQLPLIGAIALAVLWPIDGVGDVLLLCSVAGFTLLLTLLTLRAEYNGFDQTPVGGGAGYDVTNNPLAPGKIAKDNWETAVEKIADSDDDSDEEQD